MDRISIKLDIAGVIIPLNIHPKDEETLRKLAKKINEKATYVRSSYAVTESATLLAMVALQIAIDQQEKEKNVDFSLTLEQDLRSIQLVLDQILEEMD